MQPISDAPKPRGRWPAILGYILLFGLLAFLSLVGYYAWRITYDKSPSLAQEFSSNKFTRAGNLGTEVRTTVKPDDIARIIRPFSPALGPIDAPITIVFFIDFECPFCRAAHTEFASILEKYQPVIRVVFKNFPIDTLHPNAMNAANAAACAGDVGKFWQYYEELFRTQTLDETSLLLHASSLGIPKKSFDACLTAKKHQTDINTDLQDVLDLGIRGTPTYIVNGTIVEGTQDAAAWDKIIIEQLNRT